MSWLRRSLGLRGFRRFTQNFLINEGLEITGIAVFVTIPVISHGWHTQKIPYVAFGAIPVRAVEEVTLTKNHLNVVDPKLSVAPMLLIFGRISADRF